MTDGRDRKRPILGTEPRVAPARTNTLPGYAPSDTIAGHPATESTVPPQNAPLAGQLATEATVPSTPSLAGGVATEATVSPHNAPIAGQLATEATVPSTPSIAGRVATEATVPSTASFAGHIATDGKIPRSPSIAGHIATESTVPPTPSIAGHLATESTVPPQNASIAGHVATESTVPPETGPRTIPDDTLAPASDVVRQAAGPSPLSRPGSAVRSKGSVGQEMQGASIERFGRVGRDRFELLDELARGGLGRVFRARDPRTNRIVALKEVLRPQGEIISRFAREAMVTANLQHPAIVPVYEVGRWDSGEPFYAMKLVHGRTLDALITEAPGLDARIALVPHLIVVADALAYAHSERVIHRDLKPANVLVGAYGETVVIDWGLAKNLATGEEIEALPLATTIPPDTDQTMLGAVVGTPAYMPPEQALGERIDERADVYAIGAMLYHVLAGARPYRQARTMDELLHLVVNEAPQPIAQLAPDAPAELIAIAEKAMAPHPDDRYATAEGLAHDLRAYQAGKLVAAHRYTTWQLVRRWIAQHRGMVLTAAVALGVLIAIGAVGVWRIAKERDVARSERAEAQKQRGIAEERVAEGLEELGRQALLAATPEKALPLLLGAADAAPGAAASPTLGILLSVARSAYAGLAGIAPAQPDGTTSGGLAHGGAWAVTAGGDGTVRAWDIAGNHEVWSAAAARLIALSPDGSSILGVDKTGRISVLAVADGKPVHEWRPDGAKSEDVPTVLAWAPDGSHFTAATPAGRVFLGAPDSPTLASLDPHKGNVWAAAFSPDGAQLATGGDDGVAMIRDVATGKLTAQLADGPSQIATFAWLDAKQLASGDDKGLVRVWNVADRRVARKVQAGAAIYGLVAGPEAPAAGPRWLAVFGDMADVLVLDADTGAVRTKLPGHHSGVDVAAAAGALLVTTDETGNAFVWDPLTGDRIQALPNEGAILGAAASGARLLLYGNGRVRAWQLDAGRVIQRSTPHTARVRDLVWSADGKLLWSASMDGTARGTPFGSGAAVTIGTGGFTEPPISALPDGTGPPPPANPHGMRSLRLSPDGKLVATAAEDGTLLVTDVADPKRVTRFVGHTGRVRRAAFSADQRTLYSVGDTTLRAWDLATGKQRAYVDLRAPGWDVTLVDNDTVATQDEATPNVVALWRASDLKPLPVGAIHSRLYEVYTQGGHFFVGASTEIDTFAASGKPVGHAAFTAPTAASINGETIVVASAAGQIGLFAWPALSPIRSWQTGEIITAIRYRPDGAVFATAGDRHVRLWDPLHGRMLAELTLPVLATQLAWTPDGRRLAMAGASGTLWVWDLAPVDTAALAGLVTCASPWRLDDTAVVAAPFDPASCSVLAR